MEVPWQLLNHWAHLLLKSQRQKINNKLKAYIQLLLQSSSSISQRKRLVTTWHAALTKYKPYGSIYALAKAPKPPFRNTSQKDESDPDDSEARRSRDHLSRRVQEQPRSPTSSANPLTGHGQVESPTPGQQLQLGSAVRSRLTRTIHEHAHHLLQALLSQPRLHK